MEAIREVPDGAVVGFECLAQGGGIRRWIEPHQEIYLRATFRSLQYLARASEVGRCKPDMRRCRDKPLERPEDLVLAGAVGEDAAVRHADNLFRDLQDRLAARSGDFN